MKKTTDTYEGTPVPHDEFSATLRGLANHPANVSKQSLVEVSDFYGNLVTWVVRTIRVEGEDTVFLQRQDGQGADRLVLPPAVTAVLARHREGAVTVSRRRSAAQGAATRLLKKANAA
jgi:hypothetical protein